MLEVLDNSIEVTLKNKEDFLKIVETLTRIGVISENNKILYQSAHILHKQGRYFIVSFKEMFLLDGKSSTLSDEDKARRNRIAFLLEEWGLLSITNKEKFKDFLAPLSKIKIIPFNQKSEWTLTAKYSVGKKNASKNSI